MKRDRTFFMLISCFVLLSSCSLNPKVTVPAVVLAENPEESCASFARPDAWNIRAKLVEVQAKTYLVVYYNPPFDSLHEPMVSLTTGPGIYEGREGHRYYYRLGKLPKGIRIGKISIVIRSREKVMGDLADEIRTLKMERRQGSDCLYLIP